MDSLHNNDSHKRIPAVLVKALPWLAGAGFATGQILASTNCTIPEQGRCSTCGSCVIAVGSLVVWAVARNRDKDDFFIDKSSSA